ncbi:dTDP-glucose 4,6-dehydratase [Parasphingopyxis sp. CP4]|uniref:dTDP-glucose 4,6-dehydratase n=1 Tax=Parasphingopyxis sp. CP4 TaxID=2724527 RepID=UPI0015A1AC80|nr:dTDP-glucose 4,6-dehydratase [Parasphingopyxis sp. CP4]QLC21344.1 dTDP-glucose 4,6-dehydratase [Parasphingopyxis sp. CP4]
MSAILITGGAGFIGANFVRRWRATHPQDEVLVLDALTYAGHRESIEDVADVELIVGDIGDFKLVSSLLLDRNIDRIVHFAAESHVDRSIHGPDIFIATNVMGTLNLLKSAKKAWLDSGTGRPHRFHHISTDEVYGSLAPDAPAFREDTPYAPNSPYSASKAGSDHIVRAYHSTYGLDVTTSNCSNNYGPYQLPEKLIPLFLTNALHGKGLPIYGDGQHRRDWLHVSDHCRAIESIIDHASAGETYNIGGGAELANLDLIDRLCTVMDRAFAADPSLAEAFPAAAAAKGDPTASLKTHIEDRLGHDRRYAVDDSKLVKDLGFERAYTIDDGLEQTVRWYLDNAAWWRAVSAQQKMD